MQLGYWLSFDNTKTFFSISFQHENESIQLNKNLMRKEDLRRRQVGDVLVKPWVVRL